MTFEPKKDTPARRPSLPAERLLHDAHANSVAFDVTLYYDPNTKNGVGDAGLLGSAKGKQHV